MSSETILACDVGGTWLRVALVGTEGNILTRQVIPTPPDDPGALTRLMREVIDGATETVAGCVVGVPGPLDYTLGVPLRLPTLPDWEGRIKASDLSRQLALTVLLANDADLAALGEHRYGAGVGSTDMVYVTSSTGVGAGVIIGGKLLKGRLSLAEAGHTIIDWSSGATVESLGSGTALARLSEDDPAAVAARATAGDPDAARLFARVAQGFAVGVFNLVHSFSPELVVVGGGMSRAGDLLIDPVRSMLTRCNADCPASRARVAVAQGGDDAGLKGAAAFWADSWVG